MIEQLKEQIEIVAAARQDAQAYSEAKSVELEKWEEKHKDLLDNAFNANEFVREEEARLRELTLQAYAETGNKTPAKGVGIRERTILTYENKIAFDWAKAHKMALKLDARAFEKIAKADPPDFVKITTEPQATIATQLEVIE